MVSIRLQEAGHSWVGWKIFPWVSRFLLRVVELVVVSCVVELAMTLPMAVYFHRITVFALPVNLFILPLLALLMPAALLMLVLLFALPAAALVPAIVVGLVLHTGVWMVRIFGSLALEISGSRAQDPGNPRHSGAACGGDCASSMSAASGSMAALPCLLPRCCWLPGPRWRRAQSSTHATRCWLKAIDVGQGGLRCC